MLVVYVVFILHLFFKLKENALAVFYFTVIILLINQIEEFN